MAYQLNHLKQYLIILFLLNTNNDFIYLDEIESLQLQTNRSKKVADDDTPLFLFHENENSFLRCRAIGGNPLPYIRLYRDDVDITAYFKQQVNTS